MKIKIKQPTIKQLENQVLKFNKKYSVGDIVKVQQTKGIDSFFEDEIKHEATILGGHTGVTWLKNKGSYDLTHVIEKVK